jgi:hypothetical protein
LNRFTVLAAMAVAAISFGVAAVASAQESPTPAPTGTGTATANICSGTGLRGGERIPTVNGASVTPPGGGTFVIGTNPRGEFSTGSAFIVCYVEGNAEVTISSSDCEEIGRENPDDDPGADFVLDMIVDSCERTAPTATPMQPSQGSDDAMTPTPTATSGTISPPSTGDAGLK